MESDAGKAVRYLQATIKDVKSQQLIVQVAQDYERMAATLTVTPS